MFCVCVLICVKVKLSLDSLMETLIALSDTGDGAGRIEQLLKDLKSLQDRAQVGVIRSSHHPLTGQTINSVIMHGWTTENVLKDSMAIKSSMC